MRHTIIVASMAAIVGGAIATAIPFGLPYVAIPSAQAQTTRPAPISAAAFTTKLVALHELVYATRSYAIAGPQSVTVFGSKITESSQLIYFSIAVAGGNYWFIASCDALDTGRVLCSYSTFGNAGAAFFM